MQSVRFVKYELKQMFVYNKKEQQKQGKQKSSLS